MKKNEFISKVQEKAEANEVKLSKKAIEVVTDALYDAILDAVKAGERIKFGGITYEKVNVPERSGVTKLGGIEKAWTKPSHDEVKIKASKALKTAVE